MMTEAWPGRLTDSAEHCMSHRTRRAELACPHPSGWLAGQTFDPSSRSQQAARSALSAISRQTLVLLAHADHSTVSRRSMQAQ